MAFEPRDRASVPPTREPREKDDVEEKSGFQVPSGYVEHYLKGEFLPIVNDGQSQALSEREEDFAKDLGEWLWLASGLCRHLQTRDAPSEEDEPLLENLAELGEFDRIALKKNLDDKGAAELLTRTLGPEALSVLASGEYCRDEKAHYDTLLAGSAERQKADDPEPVLEALEKLPPAAFEATMAEIHRWQPLTNVLGGELSRAVGGRRHQPLDKALKEPPDEAARAQLMDDLWRLSAEETAALKAEIEERGTEAELLRLLGPELKLWLGGSPKRDLDDPRRPTPQPPRKRRPAEDDDFLDEEKEKT